jgi:RimJ/RimL family protein N-acetyltransferase
MALQDEQLDEAIGQRVVLRELTRSDVDLMAEWPRFAEPELQWANLELSTPRERDAWFDRSRSNNTRRRYTIWTDDGRAIGTIGLRNLDFRFGEGTLGIIVNAADVGRGYGTDAVRTLVGHAFRRLGRRSYEKVGFVRIGQHRGADGLIYVDMLMTRDRWQLLSRRAEPSP